MAQTFSSPNNYLIAFFGQFSGNSNLYCTLKTAAYRFVAGDPNSITLSHEAFQKLEDLVNESFLIPVSCPITTIFERAPKHMVLWDKNPELHRFELKIMKRANYRRPNESFSATLIITDMSCFRKMIQEVSQHMHYMAVEKNKPFVGHPTGNYGSQAVPREVFGLPAFPIQPIVGADTDVQVGVPPYLSRSGTVPPEPPSILTGAQGRNIGLTPPPPPPPIPRPPTPPLIDFETEATQGSSTPRVRMPRLMRQNAMVVGRRPTPPLIDIEDDEVPQFQPNEPFPETRRVRRLKRPAAPVALPPSPAAVAAAAATPSEATPHAELCKICLTNRAEMMFYKCGHICTCNDCSVHFNPLAVGKGKAYCPVCREKIKDVVKVFYS